MRHCIILLLLCISTASKFVRSQASENVQLIPGQYIVYYADDADRTSTNERLFSSTSAVASSESFQVVRELKSAIAVAGISDEQYQILKDDKTVKKVIQVSEKTLLYELIVLESLLEMRLLPSSHACLSSTLPRITSSASTLCRRTRKTGGSIESIKPTFHSMIPTNTFTTALELKCT